MNTQANSYAAAALLLVGAFVYWRRQLDAGALDETDDTAPTWADEIDAQAGAALAFITRDEIATMNPSPQLLQMIRASERLRLQPYRLGDGGSTIGYGRFFPDGGPPAPLSITTAQAEAWLAEDVEARGAKWVRAYVRGPLAQHEFDALVHMAYNLSPKSFRTIANAVNAGQGPEAAALQFVRAGTNLERGLRNRRAREFALYNTGVYHA